MGHNGIVDCGEFTWAPGSILQESYAGEWARGKRDGRGAYTYRANDVSAPPQGMAWHGMA